MPSHIRVNRLWLVLCAASILVVPVVASAAGVHALFNVQSTTQAPFPSDRFTAIDFNQNTFLRVNLPFPNCTTNPSDCADVALLNQLDGFNTQPRLSIPFDGDIDPSTVNSHTVFLVRVGNLFGASDAPPSVIGINQVVWDPASHTLFAESNQHLDQHTSYLLVVTDGIHDAVGGAIERSPSFAALPRNFGMPADPRLRLYQEILDNFLNDDYLRAVANVSRKNVVAASLFTTGTVSSTLEKIRDQIKAAAAPVVSFNLGSAGERTVFPVASVIGILFTRDRPAPPNPATNFVPTPALQVFPGSVASMAFGKFHAMNFETADGFIPAVPTRTGVPAVQSTQDIFFNLFIPAGTRPSGGWPVAIFGHGFTDNKNNSPFAVASTLAHFGIATIAINAVGHGFGPNGTLTVFQSTGATVLPAGGRGVLQNGDSTFASTEGLFAAGAHADIATRDGIQETAADLMQLVRAIQGGVDVNGDGMPALDANRIYYFGQSLGGIYGTVLLGVEPDVRAGVPNCSRRFADRYRAPEPQLPAAAGAVSLFARAIAPEWRDQWIHRQHAIAQSAAGGQHRARRHRYPDISGQCQLVAAGWRSGGLGSICA